MDYLQITDNGLFTVFLNIEVCLTMLYPLWYQMHPPKDIFTTEIIKNVLRNIINKNRLNGLNRLNTENNL